MATICFVSLCIALYTVPKLPVPNFSRRVYWLAGLLLGMGYGSGSRGTGGGLRSLVGEDGRDLFETLLCERKDKLERLAFLSKRVIVMVERFMRTRGLEE